MTTVRKRGDLDRRRAVQLILRQCDQRPGDLVRDLLNRLRHEPERLSRLVDGEPLRFELALSDAAFGELWVVITAHGHVVTATQRSALGSGYRPHVLLRGSSADVLRAVLGVTPLERAVYSGVLLPLVPAPRIKRVLDHVGARLIDLVDESST